MAVRKRRRPSQREPIGNTKSAIIIYISNRGEATITDIRSHLRNEENIRNIKVIRKHLSDLVNENILSIKKAERRGLSDVYYIERSFTKFKDVFNFLNDFYRPLLLKSKYAIEMINNEDFLVYGFINIIKEMYIETLKLSDEDYFNTFIEKAKRNGEDLSVKETKEMIEYLKNQMREYKIEDIKEIQGSLLNSKPEDLLFSISKYIQNSSDPKQIIKLLVNSIFPNKQREEMLNIISVSPMAMDYFLNLKSADRLYRSVIIFTFYLQTLFLDRNKISLIKQFNENQSELKNNPMSFISRILSIQNVVNDNPLLTVLRSYFIVDSLNGNIVENEYSSKTLREILIPKVIQ
jgi:hypothetical protein